MIYYRKMNRLVNSLFEKSIKIARSTHIVDSLVFDTNRIHIAGKTKESYIGYSQCGLMSCTLAAQFYPKLLEIDRESALNLNFGYARIGYGKHLEDHMFMFIDSSGIIIDPTYKQFLKSAHCRGGSEYTKYLYEKLDPFFVGTLDELEIMIDELIDLENRCFNKTSLDKNAIMDWYEDDPSIPFDPEVRKYMHGDRDDLRQGSLYMFDYINAIKDR